MKVERLDLATVTKAVGIYLDLAYGGGAQPRRKPNLALGPVASWREVLDLFQREETQDASGRKSIRYAMRLGNRNYPFMKLVLQEHLVAGEMFFGVDTHDDMEIKPDYPDYEAWLAVQRFNRALKRQIEARFAADGLETPATLRKLVSLRAAQAGSEQHRILVVDDEEELAETVENLLRARGYGVSVAQDGRTALRLAEECLPDLILLDYELPEMDGLEVIAALRDKEATRHVPVLLATAGRIAMEDIQKADGFLAKPFPEELLYQMVQRLLAIRKVG